MSQTLQEILFNLKQELYLSNGNEMIKDDTNMALKRDEILKKIESVAHDIISSMAKGDSIEFTYRSISWKNVSFSDRVEIKTGEDIKYSRVKFNTSSSRPKFLLMVQLLEKAHQLLTHNSTVTQRELYYQLLLPNENFLKNALYCMCSMLDVTPWELGILATSKGLVCGKILIHMPEEILDCSNQGGTSRSYPIGKFSISIDVKPIGLYKNAIESGRKYIVRWKYNILLGQNLRGIHYDSVAGTLIPANVAQAQKIESEASFVLLVEKDAIFQKLLDENIFENLGPLILMTGKGFPDISTRQLLRLIWDNLQLPILALVDADPHGIEIMCVYRFGSLKKAEYSQLAVPALRWIGIHPRDTVRYGFPSDCLEALSEHDVKKAEHLLERPFIINNPQIKCQVEELLRNGTKAEIEAVGNFSNAYLTDVFLPSKIFNKEFL